MQRYLRRRPEVNYRRRAAFETLETRTLLAADYTVDTTLDVVDGSDGVLSLREAIAAAAADGQNDSDTIEFAASLFSGGPATITLGSQITISSDVQILGPGLDQLSISGNRSTRLLEVSAGVEATVEGVTLTDGFVGAGTDGGGIFNAGNLTLRSVAVTNNEAGRRGGGVYVVDGGATLRVIDSTFATNTAQLGGAIRVQVQDGTSVHITGSTFHSNFAELRGGALFVSGNSANPSNFGDVEITNTTFSSNASVNNGGAIRAVNYSRTTLVNVTMTSNTTGGNNGGGFFFSDNAQLETHNSIFVGNASTSQNYLDGRADGNLISTAGSNNLIGQANGIALSDGVNGNRTGVTNPGLAPLGNYGGPTLTHNLLAGSPALDSGSNNAAIGLTTDQRGFSRFVGAVDIGAVEFQDAPPPPSDTFTVDTVTDVVNAADGVLSLREAIAAAAADGQNDSDTIEFAANLFAGGPITITLGSQIVVDSSLHILGPGVDQLSISGANTSRLFQVETDTEVTIEGVTLTQGNVSGSGGAIHNAGELTLRSVAIVDNHASQSGGAVYVGAANASLDVFESTLAGNTAESGGAIRVDVANGTTLSMSGSTLHHNTAAASGGALFIWGDTNSSVGFGQVEITNSTFSGNESRFGGGAIRARHSSRATLINVTVTQNTSNENNGGGFYFSNGAQLLTHNSILAGNSAANSVFHDGWANGGLVDTAGSHNLIGNASNIALSNGVNENRLGVTDPRLAPLGDYGGPTLVHELLAGSLALNRGSDSAAAGLETDQRGFNRFVGTIDIGAVESTGSNNPPSIQDMSFVVDSQELAGAIIGGVVASDPEGGLLEFEITAGNSQGYFAIDPNSGVFTLAVNANQIALGPYVLEVTVADPLDAAATANVFITVQELGPPPPVADYTVDTILDVVDAADGLLSLREAIAAAASDGQNDSDSIDFAESLISGGPATITLASQIIIDSDVQILGPGLNQLSISGNRSTRLLEINAGVEVIIEGISLTEGFVSGGNDGGGIYNAGDLTLQSVAVVDNEAGRRGGGVYVADGGSILTVVDSTFAGNTAVHGGAIRIHVASGTSADIRGSTFHGNAAQNSAAALFVHGDAAGPGSHGLVNVANSTFSGNSAGSGGGAIRALGYSQTTFTNVTVTENTTEGAVGGGFYFSDNAQLVTHNSIFVGNSARNSNFLDGRADGNLVSTASSNNLFGQASNIALSNGVNGNRQGITDAGLAPLGNNGGSTLTHDLLAGSPALDSGSDSAAAGLVTDQRGFNRFVGTVDIGAVEGGASAPLVDIALRELNASGNEFAVAYDLFDRDFDTLFVDIYQSPDGVSLNPADLLITHQIANASNLQQGAGHIETFTAVISPTLNADRQIVAVVRTNDAVMETNVANNQAALSGALFFGGPAGSQLFVYGTDGNDSIMVGDSQVTINGTALTGIAVSSASAVYIQARAGNDVVELASDLTITSWMYGGAGDDVVTGAMGDDNIAGGRGNDTIHGRTGQDTLNGGQDADTYLLSNSGPAEITVLEDVLSAAFDTFDFSDWSGPEGVSVDLNLASQFLDAEQTIQLHLSGGRIEILQGSRYDDILIGNQGVNVILGRSGNDVIDGGPGAGAGDIDLLGGDEGSDRFVISEQSAPRIQISNNVKAPGDRDALDFGHSSQPVVVNLAGGLLGSARVVGTVGPVRVEEVGNFPHIEDVFGSDLDDILTGNNADNMLFGGKGNDTLDGKGGNDTYSFGHDEPNEQDTIIADDGGTLDALDFSNFPSSIIIALGIDGPQLVGTNYRLNLSGLQIEKIVGTQFDDVLTGNEQAAVDEVFEGNGGNDLLFGHLGNDTYVFAGEDDLGSDTVFEQAGEGTDSLDFSGLLVDDGFGGGITADLNLPIIANVPGHVAVSYDDSVRSIENIVGTSFNDHLIGTPTDNVLEGRGGDDILHGADGNDVYRFSGPDLGFDTVGEALLGGIDTLDFSGFAGGLLADLLNDLIVDSEHLQLAYEDTIGREIENVIGSAGDDTILGNLLANELDGRGGRDLLEGREGDDILRGGDTDDGSDTLVGGAGNDMLFGGAGIDNLEGGEGNDGLHGGAGSDTYHFAGPSDLGTDTVFEGAGIDSDSDTLRFIDLVIQDGVGIDLAVDIAQQTIVDKPNHIRLVYSDGNRSIENVIGTAVDDEISGNAADNVLDGVAGADLIRGADGNDTIIGDQVSSKIFGQSGFDGPEIVDDQAGEEPQLTLSGVWNVATGGLYNGQHYANDPAATATWEFDELGPLGPSPSVEIFVTWDPGPLGAFTLEGNAVFKVTFNGAVHSFAIDMNEPPGDVVFAGRTWKKLAQIDDVNSSLVVELSHDSTNVIIADAVMLRSPDQLPSPPSNFEIDGARLEWDLVDAPGFTEIDGFRIQRSKTGLGEASWKDWQEANALLSTNPNARSSAGATLSEETYYYRIRTLSATRGNSNWISVDIDGNDVARVDGGEDNVVKLHVTATAGDPATLLVEWLVEKHHFDSATTYDVYKKEIGPGDWGPPVATRNAMSAVDGKLRLLDSVNNGDVFEYRVVRREGDGDLGSAEGLIVGGVQVPLDDTRGTLVLVVEESVLQPLAYEIARLVQDLIGDGWTVVRRAVDAFPEDASGNMVNEEDSGLAVSLVKQAIKEVYDQDPENVKAVLLLGNVPVPYSGWQQQVAGTPSPTPDGHVPRALPADVYYGDVDQEMTPQPYLDGTTQIWISEGWTDELSLPFVNDPQAPAHTLMNVPRDGRFDQNRVPGEGSVELMVGRVDLSQMSDFSNDFAGTTLNGEALEMELLRRYLDKDHAYRHASFDVPIRASVVDRRSVNNRREENWKNLAPLVGYDQVIVGDENQPAFNWLQHMDEAEFATLFGSISSRGLNWNGIFLRDGVKDATEGNPQTVVADIAPRETLSVFNTLSGSFFLDWNSHSNNLMNAFLANDGYGLTASWYLSDGAEREPSYQHMAVGETIGLGNLISQVGFTRTLVPEISEALLGDPTLRMHVVSPPSAVVVEGTAENIDVNWQPPEDDGGSAEFRGYHVYRAADFGSPFLQLTLAPVTATSLHDESGSPNDIYMVRAVKLETTPSGSYFNASQGAFSRNNWDDQRILAINYGGAAVAQFQTGNPLTGISGGPIDLSHGSVTFGTPDLVFRSRRTTGDSLNHALIAAGNTYEVRLYFAETSGSSPEFDVTIEGQTVLVEYDVVAEVGANAGVVKSFQATVGADGDIDIGLSGTNTFLSAVEVFRVG